MNEGLLIQELERDEGIRRSRYKDSNDHWTIGVGHNLDVSPLPKGWVEPLSDSQIAILLRSDLAKIIVGMDHILGTWWRSLSDNRQRALVNMAFNLGAGGLASFNTFLGYMKAGQFGLASADLKTTKWASEVGDRAKRIEALILDAPTTNPKPKTSTVINASPLERGKPMNFIEQWFNTQVLIGIAKWALTGLAGYLTTKGIVSADGAAQLQGEALGIITLFIQWWSSRNHAVATTVANAVAPGAIAAAKSGTPPA